MNSQSLVGTNTNAIPIMKSQLQNVLPAYSTSIGLTSESPCATAAVKRTSYEKTSNGSNPLVGSNASVGLNTLTENNATDPGYKNTGAKPEDSSDADEEIGKSTIKIEPSTIEDVNDSKDKLGPSPSKAKL